MFVAETKIRVRYAETDQMGYVHHGNYAMYFELARVDAIERIGITYKGLEASGVAMPVAHMSIDFKRPAFFDETLTIKTIIRQLPTSKFITEYEVYNDTELITKANIVLVFINLTTRRPVRCPQEIMNGLLPYFSD